MPGNDQGLSRHQLRSLIALSDAPGCFGTPSVRLTDTLRGALLEKGTGFDGRFIDTPAQRQDDRDPGDEQF